MKKLSKDVSKYELTIQYKNKKELGDIIDEIYAEMQSTASRKNCFIDAKISFSYLR